MNAPSSRRWSLPITPALTLAIALANPAAAQTTIGAPGGSFVQSWGADNTATYGQTVTVPTDDILTSFSFWLGRTSTNFPDPENPSLSFMAYVYEWSDALGHAVGPALYTSGVYTHDATPATPFTEYSFSTGGLSLVSGGMYALFLSTSGLDGTGYIQWEASPGDDYAGGTFVFTNNGDDVSQWTNSPWGARSHDLHFEANFVGAGGPTVPEPSIWVMLVTGLLALAVIARRRRRDGGAPTGA